MKSFLTKFGLFALPILIGLIYLFGKPLNKQFAYSYLLESCERSDFLHHQLFEGDSIDIAFLGTSLTLCGIQDDSLESQLNQHKKEKERVVNLGFCRPGRNLHYVILKDLLANHSPKLILIEARFREDRYSHKDFPFIAEIKDLLDQNTFFNLRYPDIFFDALESRWDDSRHSLLALPAPPFDSSQLRPHSYVHVHVKADPMALEKHHQKIIAKYEGILAEGKDLNHQINYRYPLKTVEAMAERAKEADIPIAFYFLKSYGHPAPAPWEMETYEQYGPVWIPPDSIFQSKDNFFDKDHLNDQGGRFLTDWLAGKISTFLERM